jgi:UDP-N-acetylmuramoyl-tripeptide--D-alanyl-D-alanine ligase
MVTMSAAYLAEIVGGEVVAGPADAVLRGVEIDSRRIEPGMAFFALPGERTDGHEHVGEAIRAGARTVVVDRFDEAVAGQMGGPEAAAAAVVRVADVAESLRALAAHHRETLRCPVVGITGSTGKTSTKDFLVAALGGGPDIVATRGNHNNELGVPLTVLRAGARTSVLVVEMGMRAEGEIERLCAIVRPILGIVTNIGQTHMETLGSQEAIARAKGELVECVPDTGHVFLNGDDDWSRSLLDRVKAPVTWYGLGVTVDVRAHDVEVDDLGRPSFTLSAGGQDAPVALPVPGRHHAYTAAAAAAAALHLGVALDDIAARLGGVHVTDMRMQVFVAANGVTVVNDAYNANPASMRAAVVALADMRPKGARVAVLGDMAELGSLSELAHFRIGEAVARSGIDSLVTVGPRARRIAEGALAAGMAAGSVRPCETVEEATEVLDDLLTAGDIVLVKASRSMGLERVVERILATDA